MALQDTARRKDDKRKRVREQTKKRKEEAKQKQAEELRRLKNLKREEVKARLDKIREISGGALVRSVVAVLLNANVGYKQMNVAFIQVLHPLMG